MVATGSLGLLLAVVFVIGGRNLAPCIISHMLINFFAEPGLVLSALRGEMGRALPSAR
jgi:membrane protease YdiL (CAAX protease family)